MYMFIIHHYLVPKGILISLHRYIKHKIALIHGRVKQKQGLRGMELENVNNNNNNAHHDNLQMNYDYYGWVTNLSLSLLAANVKRETVSYIISKVYGIKTMSCTRI